VDLSPQILNSTGLHPDLLQSVASEKFRKDESGKKNRESKGYGHWKKKNKIGDFDQEGQGGKVVTKK